MNNIVFVEEQITSYLPLYRATPSRTLKDRKKLEVAYVILEVHVKVLHQWIALVLFPALVNAASGVIIALYIPIRHPEIPTLLNLCILVFAALLLVIAFSTSYDIVLVTRACEEVLGKLKTFGCEQENGNDISPLQRLRFIKRAKACRCVEILIGTFGVFSLDVPVILWDEILNQLLFLLSF